MKRHRNIANARVSVLNAALIRALVKCAAGLDYEDAMEDARTLAAVADPRRDTTTGTNNETGSGSKNSHPMNNLSACNFPKQKKSHSAKVAIQKDVLWREHHTPS